MPHPRPGQVWYLEVVRGEGAAQKVLTRLALERPLVVLGRHPAMAQILAAHESISRQHAALVWHAAQREWLLADLRSAKGTVLGGQRLEPFTCHPLREGGHFLLGESSRQYTIKLLPSGQEVHEVEERATKRARSAEKEEPKEEVQAAHILVKHRESRKPLTWQGIPVTRTKEEALQKLLALQKELDEGASFAALAQAHSDCSSAKRGGDLGPFSRGAMQPPFEQAAFALKPGETTRTPVWTDSGVHLIRRLR